MEGVPAAGGRKTRAMAKHHSVMLKVVRFTGWPLFVIVAGVIVLLSALFGRGSTEHRAIPQQGPVEPGPASQPAVLEDIEPPPPSAPETTAQDYKRKEE